MWANTIKKDRGINTTMHSGGGGRDWKEGAAKWRKGCERFFPERLTNILQCLFFLSKMCFIFLFLCIFHIINSCFIVYLQYQVKLRDSESLTPGHTADKE